LLIPFSVVSRIIISPFNNTKISYFKDYKIK
jgi:hypothetical protein